MLCPINSLVSIHGGVEAPNRRRCPDHYTHHISIHGGVDAPKKVPLSISHTKGCFNTWGQGSPQRDADTTSEQWFTGFNTWGVEAPKQMSPTNSAQRCCFNTWRRITPNLYAITLGRDMHRFQYMGAWKPPTFAGSTHAKRRPKFQYMEAQRPPTTQESSVASREKCFNTRGQKVPKRRTDSYPWVCRCFNTWGHGSPQPDHRAPLPRPRHVSIHGGVKAPNDMT